VAPDQPGALTEEFTVTITGSSEPVTFKVHGKVAGQTATRTSATSAGGNATAQTNP